MLTLFENLKSHKKVDYCTWICLNTLRKWAWNTQKLLDNLSKNHHLNAALLAISETENPKTVGVGWNPKANNFFFSFCRSWPKIHLSSETQAATKIWQSFSTTVNKKTSMNFTHPTPKDFLNGPKPLEYRLMSIDLRITHSKKWNSTA